VRGIGEPTEPVENIGGRTSTALCPAPESASTSRPNSRRQARSDVFVAADCVNVDAATLKAILADPASFYVNIHTVQFPAGAIAGTLA
jgi:CHRD domain